MRKLDRKIIVKGGPKVYKTKARGPRTAQTFKTQLQSWMLKMERYGRKMGTPPAQSLWAGFMIGRLQVALKENPYDPANSHLWATAPPDPRPLALDFVPPARRK